MTKINVQMYSFSAEDMNDSRENLKRAAEMGYAGVELFGPNYEIPAEEMKSLLQELNLELISLHAATSKEVEGLIPYAETAGSKFLGIGVERFPDEKSVHAFAEHLNELGEKCKTHGLTLTYHNHTDEFAPCGEERIIDVLMKETDPKNVSFELDAGWCAAAGYDPIELVEQYSGRVKLIHIKESDKVVGTKAPLDFESIPKDETGRPMFTEEQIAILMERNKINCVAGKGLVDWAKLQEAADQHGCQAYIVEREYTPEGTRLEVLAKDLKYYQSVMK